MSFSQQNENSADPAAMLKVIQLCSHCGDVTNKGNKYCTECVTVGKRREMCEENKKLNPKHKCKTCDESPS